MAANIRIFTRNCRLFFTEDFALRLTSSPIYAQSRKLQYIRRPISHVTDLSPKKAQIVYTKRQNYSTTNAIANDSKPESPVLSPGRLKAVVFDKNGTLINFHEVWTPWVQLLTSKLESATGLKLEHKILECLNVCVFTKRTRSGLLAEGSTQQIKRHLENLLVKEGFDRRRAQLVIEQNWKDCDTGDPATLKQLADLKVLFTKLRAQDIKIVVCTSDSRRSTEKTLNNLDLISLVDFVTCGDDVDAPAKHHVQSLNKICQRINVNPEEVVVVGDTVTDMKMGRQGGAGATIGVLSGIGTRLDLIHFADHIIDDVQHLEPLLIPENTQSNTNNTTTNPTKKTVVDPDITASLVIFDKDGTLLCFHSMWTPWALGLAKRMVEATGMDLHDKTLEELGFCLDRKKWIPGVFTEGTNLQTKVKLEEMLQNSGITDNEAKTIVENAWTDGDAKFEGKTIKALDNPLELFLTLKKFDVKIAVCTADNRGSTIEFLETIGAMKYVDMLVCGDDAETEPKPSPYNVRKICKELNIDPNKAVVIGDTMADMEMGKSAKLGATVAVLSGVGEIDDLKDHADHMVPSIKHLMNILTPKSHVEVEKL